MNITTGVQAKPVKAVIYGPEGIGKSTFAAQFPQPLFIDTEGSTTRLNVARTDTPTSLAMLSSMLDELRQNMCGYKTLVIDTADWAERLCIKAVCEKNQKSGIEEFGYGKGFTYVYEEMGRILNQLTDIWEHGANIVITAHAAIRKFEQPDEMGAYDRWELKLINAPKCNVCAMIKEWSDLVLFANYKTYSVAVDKDGKKHKAQGGERVMYTTHNPCWDAKNRFDLAPELPFEFVQIAHIFAPQQAVQMPVQQNVQQTAPQTAVQTPPQSVQPAPQQTPPQNVQPEQQNVQQTMPDTDGFEDMTPRQLNIPDSLPKELKDLMQANGVDESDIRLVCSQRGYFTYDTPMTAYPPDFVMGCLVGAWAQMLPLIRENQAVPFV
ncbi:ATP-binding protein [uncultured Ruminococcus sp.]|uniref:ATP-binding protein n=1 Tax=uncultured Ruminococcus sp. TaxID=165186 RepID=UPI0025DCC706|nr:ATP-binding protein [uncultured Ruminococcus sp.]